MSGATDTERFKRLPERVPPERLRAEHESRPVPEEKDDQLRETEWFLKNSG
jgi:hypothetical protein